MSLWSRLRKLEARRAGAADAGVFLGSPRSWAAVQRPWPPPDLTDAERDELRPLFSPTDHSDPVEDAIREMEARALKPTAAPKS